MTTTQELINKYLDGNTTLQEEETLRQQLQAIAHPTDEQRALLMMLGPATKVALMPDSATLAAGEAEYNKVMRQRKRRTTLLRIGMPLAIAAVLILAVLLVPHMSHNATESELVAKTAPQSALQESQHAAEPQEQPYATAPAKEKSCKRPALTKTDAAQADAQAKHEPNVAQTDNHDLAMAVEPAIITARLKTNSPASELYEINDVVPFLQ